MPACRPAPPVIASGLVLAVLLALLGVGSIPLPGGPPVKMDYLAYDGRNERLWVPAGNTEQVDVIDLRSRKVTTVAWAEPAPAGHPERGPSSATVGAGVVWIGNRDDGKLCAFDALTLERGACVQLASPPDGLAYVGPTHELWATTPHDHSITVVNVAGGKPAKPVVIKVDGVPEGYAVDAAHGVFYTNLEDKDRTLAIDIRTHDIRADYASGCGAPGPRGLALAGVDRLLFVACTDGAATLDLAHQGAPISRLKTGEGVDGIDYYAVGRLLYVASAEAGTLSIARVSDDGALTVVATVPTAAGARNAVVDASGIAYVADSRQGQLIVVAPPHL
jgi:outer membrane protein assembly factor BamB